MNKKNIIDESHTLGSWIQIGDPDLTRMMASSGFEFLVMDMEHGSIMEKDLLTLFNALKGTDCIPIVRVAENNSILIRRALDLGAKGIIVPGVNSAEDVENAEKAIYYTPKGERGIGYSRVNSYGLEFSNYFKSSNDNVVFVVQIEHQAAVNNIDEIFSSDNIDSYIIGPYDLTGSMGIVGEFNNPDYQNNLKKIKKSAEENGINSGIHVVNPNINELKSAVDDGYNFIAYSTDALLIYDKCKNDLNVIANLERK